MEISPLVIKFCRLALRGSGNYDSPCTCVRTCTHGSHLLRAVHTRRQKKHMLDQDPGPGGFFWHKCWHAICLRYIAANLLVNRHPICAVLARRSILLCVVRIPDVSVTIAVWQAVPCRRSHALLGLHWFMPEPNFRLLSAVVCYSREKLGGGGTFSDQDKLRRQDSKCAPRA